jgi:hypothetical protein
VPFFTFGDHRPRHVNELPPLILGEGGELSPTGRRADQPRCEAVGRRCQDSGRRTPPGSIRSPPDFVAQTKPTSSHKRSPLLILFLRKALSIVESIL